MHVFVDTRTLAICADEDIRKDRGRARSVVQVVRLCCINHVTVSYPSRKSTLSAGPHHLGYIQIPRSQFQPFFFPLYILPRKIYASFYHTVSLCNHVPKLPRACQIKMHENEAREYKSTEVWVVGYICSVVNWYPFWNTIDTIQLHVQGNGYLFSGQRNGCP